MLILNQNDLEKVLSPNEVMDSIERAYELYETGNMFMPPRIHVDCDGKTLLYMPCFAEGFFGTKSLTVFPENAAKGLPVIDGLMVLNDYETGKPLAALEGKTLTALRTGAVGGVAIRHTTPESAFSVGIIGAGTQGYYQALFACKARGIRKILVFDKRSEATTSLVGRLSDDLSGVKVEEVRSVERLLASAQIVITATTSEQPVLPDEPSLLAGKHFVGIGSYKPSMREYPQSLFGLLAKVYVDTEHAVKETGDLVYPLTRGLLRRDQVETFGNYLATETDKAAVSAGTTFVKSVGMALFDLVVSRLAYDKAVAAGYGTKADL